MNTSIYTSLLGRGQTGNDILRILEVIGAEITEANIASCAEIFEVKTWVFMY